jgi:hypothetical protein
MNYARGGIDVMSKCDDGKIRIEAGQILNPENFPLPTELVCVQVPKVFDQVSLRDCVTRNIVLKPHPCVANPVYAFEGASNFDITEVKVISKTDSMTRPGFKRLKLFVKIRYDIFFTDGVSHHKQSDEAAFNLTINEIYCPNCMTQVGIIRYPKDYSGFPCGTLDVDGLLIKVEALAEAFNDMINSCTGALTLDIGAFFIVKCECIVQLLMPAYGYCPVPPEQINPASQTCISFNDRIRTPFPTTFFPDQKWNPLDR